MSQNFKIVNHVNQKQDAEEIYSDVRLHLSKLENEWSSGWTENLAVILEKHPLGFRSLKNIVSKINSNKEKYFTLFRNLKKATSEYYVLKALVDFSHDLNRSDCDTLDTITLSYFIHCLHPQYCLAITSRSHRPLASKRIDFREDVPGFSLKKKQKFDRYILVNIILNEINIFEFKRSIDLLLLSFKLSDDNFFDLKGYDKGKNKGLTSDYKEYFDSILNNEEKRFLLRVAQKYNENEAKLKKSESLGNSCISDFLFSPPINK